jgi:hypothetical protein
MQLEAEEDRWSGTPEASIAERQHSRGLTWCPDYHSTKEDIDCAGQEWLWAGIDRPGTCTCFRLKAFIFGRRARPLGRRPTLSVITSVWRSKLLLAGRPADWLLDGGKMGIDLMTFETRCRLGGMDYAWAGDGAPTATG